MAPDAAISVEMAVHKVVRRQKYGINGNGIALPQHPAGMGITIQYLHIIGAFVIAGIDGVLVADATFQLADGVVFADSQPLGQFVEDSRKAVRAVFQKRAAQMYHIGSSQQRFQNFRTLMKAAGYRQRQFYPAVE